MNITSVCVTARISYSKFDLKVTIYQSVVVTFFRSHLHFDLCQYLFAALNYHKISV